MTAEVDNKKEFPERVVFVDDDEDMRFIVREALERSGVDCKLVTCSSGQELLTRLKELQPDLVLLDLKMPGMSGPDVIESLMVVEHGDMPIIFITGNTNVEMTQEYKKLNVLGVIHKPLESAKLADTISELWAKR